MEFASLAHNSFVDFVLLLLMEILINSDVCFQNDVTSNLSCLLCFKTFDTFHDVHGYKLTSWILSKTVSLERAVMSWPDVKLPPQTNNKQ